MNIPQVKEPDPASVGIELPPSSGDAGEPKKVVSVGDLLPPDTTCRIWRLNSSHVHQFIRGKQNNFKVYINNIFHSRNQVFLAPEIDPITVDFYFR